VRCCRGGITTYRAPVNHHGFAGDSKQSLLLARLEHPPSHFPRAAHDFAQLAGNGVEGIRKLGASLVEAFVGNLRHLTSRPGDHQGAAHLGLIVEQVHFPDKIARNVTC
jgi:hypothetical protein